MTDLTAIHDVEEDDVMDDVMKQELLAMAQRVFSRYEYLMKVCLRKDNGQLLAITPDESAAILTRFHDGTINRNGIKILTDAVIERNQEFLDSIPKIEELLKKIGIEPPLIEENA
jgi:hypothetical protein